MGQIKNIKLHIVTDIKKLSPIKQTLTKDFLSPWFPNNACDWLTRNTQKTSLCEVTSRSRYNLTTTVMLLVLGYWLCFCLLFVVLSSSSSYKSSETDTDSKDVYLTDRNIADVYFADQTMKVLNSGG